MPGLIWLQMHPPKHEIFPWWVKPFLVGMIVVAVALLVFVAWTVASDIIKEWRKPHD